MEHYMVNVEEVESMLLDRFEHHIAMQNFEIAKELGQILNWILTGEDI